MPGPDDFQVHSPVLATLLLDCAVCLGDTGQHPGIARLIGFARTGQLTRVTSLLPRPYCVTSRCMPSIFSASQLSY